MNNSTKRVFLWTHPRALSTAFMRCMEGLPHSKVVFEPFTAAQLYGPGGDFEHLPGCSVDLEYSYGAVKRRLEEDYTGTQLVFVKDMAYGLGDNFESIPSGYQHSFLIRNPVKTFVSYFKCIDESSEGLAYREIGLPDGYFYGEIVRLYEYLLSKGEKPPMIIDADDLLENPDLMMRDYCQRMNVGYSESILNWGHANTDNWIASKEMLNKIFSLTWLENSVKAGGFSKSVSKPAPPMDSVNSDVQDSVEGAMPFYEELYKLRHRVRDN